MLIRQLRTAAVLVALMSLSARAIAATSPEQRNLEELRNTISNLLQALVDKGVLTREQAQAMVKNAEDKAAADAAAALAQEQKQAKEDEGAVRVPYVPQIVKDEIRKEVVSDLAPNVKQQVVDDVNAKGGLFRTLPEWMQRMRFTGDVRVRQEGDEFGSGNVANTYLDFNQVNAKGGIAQAGANAFLDTTEDRDRLRLRLRFGFDADLGDGFQAAMRLATGSGEIFLTTNQTLGNYGQRYQIAVDQGYISWNGKFTDDRQQVMAEAGRFANPYVASDLMWYNDLTFEGVASSYRFNLISDKENRRDVYLTAGAFPLSNFSPLDPNTTYSNKWLGAAQAGVDLHFGDSVRVALAGSYYDFIHISGELNTPDSTLLNWSAPVLVQKGNTMFQISNPSNPTANPLNLFGLAADYRIVDLIATTEYRFNTGYMVGVTAEGLDNIGFDAGQVFARTGTDVPARTHGYRADVTFGSSRFGDLGTWQAAIGYRYVQRDAVVDAFNDQDFHLGGTDAKGYTLRFDYSINPRVFVRLKYMAADAIDGPPLNIDVWQVDLNTRF
ncbi:MAG TPA: putative porin [Steroidobacteraceae bacterium]|jgi:hypothetical protein